MKNMAVCSIHVLTVASPNVRDPGYNFLAWLAMLGGGEYDCRINDDITLTLKDSFSKHERTRTFRAPDSSSETAEFSKKLDTELKEQHKQLVTAHIRRCFANTNSVFSQWKATIATASELLLPRPPIRPVVLVCQPFNLFTLASCSKRFSQTTGP